MASLLVAETAPLATLVITLAVYLSVSGAKCTVTAIGCCIPQQSIIQRGIDRFQRVTDVVVTAASDGISRCSDTAVSVHHSIPAQSIGNVVTNTIKL